jgi:hypothetical protein
LPALAVYLGEEEKTTEKGKIENRILYFKNKRIHRKRKIESRMYILERKKHRKS